jgi:hypothetical protein
MKKYFATTVASLCILGIAAAPGLAATPGEKYNPHAASVNNTNANANAGWGQDRSFYASGGARDELGWDNLDIKQSFPTTLGNVGDQRAAWVADWTDPHGPTE